MKRQELERVVEKQLGQIEKYAQKIPGHFGTEDIHELRVEFKKARAFLRLLQNDKDSYDLHIPGKLKSVYKAAGVVRDLQLFIERINSLLTSPQQAPQLQKWLQQRLFEKKEALVKEIEHAGFTGILKTVKHHLPGVMENSAIEKFLHFKIAAIHIVLLAVQQEKDLHTIRKHLKDIIYNIRTFQQHWGISFPLIAWKSEKLMNDIATGLGNFNDECIAVSFLQAAHNKELPPGEKYVIDAWLKDALEKQEQQQQQLIQQVKQLQLSHSFRSN